MQQAFRQAKPTDVIKAIPLIYSSGPNAWEYVFATKKTGNATNFIKYCFLRNGGQLGYDNHIVGEIEDNVISCATCYSSNVELKYLLKHARNILAFYSIIDAIKVMVRGIRTEFIIKPPKGNSHLIGHIGVDVNYRGKGLGQQLVGYLINLGKKNKRSHVELDVAFDNVNAYRLYQKLGFTDYKYRKGSLENEFGKVVDHIKMRKVL